MPMCKAARQVGPGFGSEPKAIFDASGIAVAPARTTRSLYLRLMLTTLVPLVLAGACAFLIAIVLITRTLESRTREQTEHAAQVLAESDLSPTPELLRRFSALQRADFYLIDPQGRIALSSRDHPPPELERMLNVSGAARHSWQFDLEGGPVVAARATLTGGDRRYRELVAVSSLRDAREATKRAAAALAAAVLAATALLAFLVHVLVEGIARPLRALADFAATLGKGTRGVQTPVSRSDEVGDLERALNTMSQQIDRHESQLAERSRLSALGEMAARIAHEVRNPLTGLKMHLQMLAERVPDHDLPRLRMLLAEVQRLELVVDASLMLARERVANLAAENLCALVTNVVELMTPSFEHRGIRIECRLAPIPPLPLDRALIEQAVLNLLANASDAMPQGGDLLISASCDTSRGSARLVVEDSGPGFGAELLSDDSKVVASTKPFGLGVGLSVCREVARLHGGSLILENSPAGAARVTLALPLVSRPQPVIAAVSEQ
jgi:signal transduction histidine kinase